MNVPTITFCNHAMSPAQWLAMMGVIRHCPECPNRWAPGMQVAAMSFDAIVNLATKRGFTGRRLLKAAAGRRIEAARQSGTWTSLLDRSTAHERKRIRPTATTAKRRSPAAVKKASKPTSHPLPRAQGAT